MNKVKTIGLIAVMSLIMVLGDVSAHEDFYVTKAFGNIKVRIQTGFEYEEINNVALLGQSAEKLCKALNYYEPVLLDFIHSNRTPVFFVSYENLAWGGNQGPNLGDFMEGNAIVVRQVGMYFQSQTTLKLLEYAILNLNDIKSTQKQVVYNEAHIYNKWKIHSIDSLIINNILKTPNSNLVNNTLQHRIYRTETDFRHGVSYYMQNNRYHVFRKDSFSGKETGLIDLECIYDFKRTGNRGNWVIFFDSDSSFYYAGGLSQISRRHVIENMGNHRPYNIAYIGEGKLAIYFWYWKREREEDEVGEYILVGDKERTMIYLTKEDKLIPNLDKLLKQQ